MKDHRPSPRGRSAAAWTKWFVHSLLLRFVAGGGGQREGVGREGRVGREGAVEDRDCGDRGVGAQRGAVGSDGLWELSDHFTASGAVQGGACSDQLVHLYTYRPN